ncbi:hypothetical protein [Nonomuraea sp. NPDC052265]
MAVAAGVGEGMRVWEPSIVVSDELVDPSPVAALAASTGRS